MEVKKKNKSTSVKLMSKDKLDIYHVAFTKKVALALAAFSCLTIRAVASLGPSL